MTQNTDTDDILDTPTEDVQVVDATAVVDDTSILSDQAVVVQDDNNTTTTKRRCFLTAITMDAWVLIWALVGIAFQFLALMLVGITSDYVVYQVFAYLGYLSVIASAAIYIVQMIRTKVMAFTPQLVILILAILMSSPLV